MNEQEYTYGDSLGFRIFDTHRSIAQSFSRVLKGFGLTPALWNVLNQTERDRGVSQRELAKRVQRTDGAIARLVNVLEERDLVERIRDPADKRIFMVKLTEEGKVLREKIRPLAIKNNESLLSGLSDEDVAALKHLLSVIKDNAARN